MSSRRPQQRRTIDRRRLLELAQEASTVAGLVTRGNDYWTYQPALFACCYAIIRIGEGVRQLDSGSRRRLRSVSLAIWEDWRNMLAHDLDLANHDFVFDVISDELPLLLRDLERLRA